MPVDHADALGSLAILLVALMLIHSECSARGCPAGGADHSEGAER